METSLIQAKNFDLYFDEHRTAKILPWQNFRKAFLWASKQQSLSSVRERSGLALRIKAGGSLSGFSLSSHEKRLLGNISRASESMDWKKVRSLLATYTGTAVPIYTAAMHGAFRCRKYKEGSLIYEECHQSCKELDQPIFTLALKIYGKLGKKTEVRKVWDEALEVCNVSQVLASARISLLQTREMLRRRQGSWS